jgi:signal transduction histidine kinase
VTIARTRGPARIDDYGGVPGRIAAFMRDELEVTCSVGSPIVVEGRLWGALFVHSKQPEPLPPDTESRLESFTELVATAMANAEARAEVRRLAEEQAALRRVATLVARGSSAAEVFAAVAEEVGLLLDVQDTTMFRYEDDGTAIALVDRGGDGPLDLAGSRITLDADTAVALVFRTGLPARVDDYSTIRSSVARRVRGRGIRAGVGSPIVVDGRLWGVMVAGTRKSERFPADTESRMGEFTELLATAISNIQAHADLAASRARIVASADQERRRVVRDLHDGGQQRLVHTVIMLKQARRALQDRDEAAGELVDAALDNAERATTELRELAHGILPAVLTRGGLRAGVEALASRMELPVRNSVSVGRLPADVEATAYFVVAEALTNVAKHSRATRAAVSARVEKETLHLHVRDDGVGGAQVGGSGLLGLADRLAVLDGHLRVVSPTGGGTLVAVAIPIAHGVTHATG